MQSGYDTAGRAADYAERSATYAGKSANTVLDTAVSSGLAWLDLMMSFQRELQRASLQSFAPFSPASQARSGFARTSVSATQAQTGGIQVVPVGEERLNVAVHTVPGETTRVRRRVISQPVEQQVTLRDEKVVVERRRPADMKDAGPKDQVLTETVIEMSDSRQVPTAWKSLHVAEEVVLRKQVTERTEAVRDTVRRDVVDVEHDTRAPRATALATVPQPRAAEHHEDRAEAGSDEAADKKQAAPVPQSRKG